MQVHEFIEAALPIQNYQVAITVIVLVTDWSSRHDFPELVYVDIFYVRVFKREKNCKIFINRITFQDKY
jgi:hypothetical protein